MCEGFKEEISHLNLKWVLSDSHEASSDRKIEWTYVESFAEINLKLGLSSNGWWVTLGPDTVVEFSPDKKPIFLLPILKMLPNIVRKRLTEALKCKSLPTSCLDRLPFEEVVILGLESLSEQWTNLALDWVEYFPDNQELIHAINVVTKEMPSQKIKQKAKKKLKALQAVTH